MAAYAKTVSKNAKRWLAKAQKDLDTYMASHGYAEKVWHGTEGEDFNVFRSSAISHDVPAVYFTYNHGTAQNYAALRAEDVDGQPNTRQFYVNTGRVLDIDEDKSPSTFAEFVAKITDAYNRGYDSVRVRNALDDQGIRLDENDGGEPRFTATEEEPELKTDILIVFDRPGNPGADRIKAADPVTFMDDVDGALPIPRDMRADPSVPDVRYSVRVAMQDLADGKEKATLHNGSLGDIEYNIGRTGKNGFGLLHIVEQRILKDGATLEEAVDTAINVATAAEIGEETETRHNTHHLDYNGTRAIVGVMPDKSIVITGYEIYAGESTVAKQRAAELSPRPHVRLDEVVRVLKEKLASAEESIAYPAAEVNGVKSQNLGPPSSPPVISPTRTCRQRTPTAPRRGWSHFVVWK